MLDNFFGFGKFYARWLTGRAGFSSVALEGAHRIRRPLEQKGRGVESVVGQLVDEAVEVRPRHGRTVARGLRVATHYRRVGSTRSCKECGGTRPTECRQSTEGLSVGFESAAATATEGVGAPRVAQGRQNTGEVRSSSPGNDFVVGCGV